MARVIFVLFLALSLSGCYNPLNRATADRYGQTCREAQATGQLAVAEEACRRALINVRIGHLGDEAESQELYNLGRVKRQIGKYEEAEELHKESLKIQESLSPPDQAKIGRRLAEIAIAIGEQGRVKDAWPFLVRLIPIADLYSGQERFVVKGLFEFYAKVYQKLGMQVEATQLLEKAKTL